MEASLFSVIVVVINILYCSRLSSIQLRHQDGDT